MAMNRRIVLANRPSERASSSNFRLEEVSTPALAPDQVLVRNHFLSLDPYMRGRMNDSKSYAAPQALGEVMIGGTVGEVAESRNALFPVGSKVVGALGWQEYGIADGKNLNKVESSLLPLSAYLGAVGMPGVTAWYGLKRVIDAQAGQTVVVSAASGAVGSVVGQLARLSGCRTIGIAGGEEKCRYVTETLGFDACIDYKSQDVEQELKAVAPQGVDGYFENVGGAIMDAVLPSMNDYGRIALCGLIASYDRAPLPIINPRWFLSSRLTMQGFIVSEHMDVWPTALSELAAGVSTGNIKYRETVALGIEMAPKAFLGMLRGANLGKQLVKLI